jgi:hypothetical protein
LYEREVERQFRDVQFVKEYGGDVPGLSDYRIENKQFGIPAAIYHSTKIG